MIGPFRTWLRLAAGLIVLLSLAGCCRLARMSPPGLTPTTAATPTPTAVPTITTLPTAAPTGAPGTKPTPRVPQAPLFGPPWSERTIYRTGLTPGEWPILDALDDASEYRIDLTIADSFTEVQGRQQVRYTNQEEKPLSEIYMRLFPNALGGEMAVSSITVDGQSADVQTHFARTALLVTLPVPLAPGASTVIELAYRITVPETLDTGYGLLSYTDGILALDTPYAPIPVYDDEGWNVEDPPATADTSYYDVSLYLVRVTAPPALALAAAGVEVERTAEEAAQTVTFAHGPARDFSLAASVAYDIASQQVDDVLIRSFALESGRVGARIASDVAVEALRIFAERFGPYPFSEFDVAATPMLALGIEYPGIIGISAEILDGDAPHQALIETTVAHEVAHQWFYGLVGNDQADEPWLDEALAQYATWLYYLDRYGEAPAELVREGWFSRWERVDRAAVPVGLPAAAYDGLQYGAIVYGRGPLFVSALAERMGQETFDRFLREYSDRHRWGIATTASFEEMAEAACDCSLDDLFSEWLAP